MKKLISEQLLHDGGYHLPKMLHDANERLKKDGVYGKTCQLKRSGNSVTIQFHFQKQENKGCGCQYTAKGIERAEQIARLVTSQLIADNFTWDWFYRAIGKKDRLASQQPKTMKALLDEYKKHWFKENSNLKNPQGQWYMSYFHLESVAQDENHLNESIVKKIVSRTKPNSHVRSKTLNALVNFCQFFEIDDFNSLITNFKKKNKIPKNKKYIPDDREIELTYEKGFLPSEKTRKNYYYRFFQWQFLYSLLAIYGLRIHEAWNIANWNNSVKIKKGDWVIVEDFDEQETEIQYLGNDFIIPAILNPNNKEKILCISHNTKTGYRMAFPLSPYGKDWVKDFNLIQSINLPDVPNPLEGYGKTKKTYNCTNATVQWFKRYAFTAHALRHAYNHRGHGLGINPTLLAQSLGHGLQVNSSTYLNTMPDSRKLENFKNAIEEQTKKQTRLEELEIENIQLKAENEMLKAKLQLIYSERSGNL